MATYSGSSSSCSLVLLVAIAVRLFFMYSPASDWFKNRIELSTPLTSWNRVQEGLALLSHGISPYSGDVVHEVPLVLVLFHFVKKVSCRLLPLVFVTGPPSHTDTGTHNNSITKNLVLGHLVNSQAAQAKTIIEFPQTKNKYVSREKEQLLNTQLSEQKARKTSFAKNASPVLLKDEALTEVPFLTTAVYLLNPYTISSCVAQSTVIFTNFGVVLALYSALKGNVLLATMGVAIATYHSLYPIMLLSPIVLLILKSKQSRAGLPVSVVAIGCIKTIVLFLIWIAGLMLMSYFLFNSMDFIQATYGFILSVPDLTPNIGLFWYFFMEMFEHFRVFFLWVFQLNAFFYCIPLTIRLRDHPSFLACMLCSVMTIMKSYPSFGDAALSMSLLVLWKHTFSYMRNSFLITCMLLFSTFLAPVFWYLWIYAGSANANFFFAITLVYSTAQILLSSDVLFAFLRREYDLVHGIYPAVINGEVASVIFK